MLLFLTSLLILHVFPINIVQKSKFLYFLQTIFNLQKYGTNRTFLAQFFQKLWLGEVDQNSGYCAVLKSLCSGPKFLPRPNLSLHLISFASRETTPHIFDP